MSPRLFFSYCTEQEFMKNNPPVMVEVHLPPDLETNKPLTSDKVKMKFELNATIENVKKRLSKEIGVGFSMLRVKHGTIPGTLAYFS